LPKHETLRKVDVVRADPVASLHKGFLSSAFLTEYRRLVRHSDVVHLHVPMLEAGPLASLTPSSIPIITSWYCDLAPSDRFSLIDRTAVRVVQASSKWACKKSQRVCVLSHDYASGSELLRCSAEKLTVVYPPDNAAEDLEPRPEGTTAGHPRVGFLGRFVEEKGLDVLLDAALMVIEDRPDVCFVLAGEYKAIPGGADYSRLRSRLDKLSTNVVLTGRLGYEQLFDFYRSLSVFVLPSVNAYEAFGIVQVEAMKAGVPVIASDLRGVRVPVQITGNGVLVPPRDPAALSRAIVRMLANPPATPSEIAARAWKHFSTRATADCLASLYRAAASKRLQRTAL
jgi:glycosyltransferase involved in cell wall biosynthesis